MEACWNPASKSVCVACHSPRHKNTAAFKRNDQIRDALPIGVIAFPGSGISQNPADKARKMGIAVWRCEGGA